MITVAAPGGANPFEAVDRPPAGEVRRRQGLSPVRATLIVALVGLLITVAVAWTAWTINRHNEHRLLEVQTRQATAVVSTSILSNEDPLGTALELESATGGSAQEFDQFAPTLVGPNGPFVSAVLWKLEDGSWRPVAMVGASPLMAPALPAGCDLHPQVEHELEHSW